MIRKWRTWLLPTLAIVIVVVIGGGAWFYISHDMSANIGSIGGPFQLTDGGGHTVTDRDFRGRYMLVYFGYTFCPDVCPTTLNAVAGAMDRLGKKADALQPLFITVDPARDTPKVVHDYAAAFSPRILGLTGTTQQIAKVAREYRVYFATHRTSADSTDYTVDHSSILYLMGPDGRFIAPVRADETPAEMAAEITKDMSNP